MTEYDRELQEEQELEYIKTQPFFTRLRWAFNNAKKDRDGSHRFNLMIFLFILGVIAVVYILEEVL